MTGSDHSIIAILMMILLGTSIMGGAVLFFLIGRRLRRQAANEPTGPEEIPTPGAHPIFLFERPQRWLAVKSADASRVQQALGVHNPTPCSWVDGFSKMAERRLFISPPVKGWVLVIGSGLPDPCEDADVCFHFILALSKALGSVQMFSVNRVLHHNAWIRAENDRIYRAYAWAGQTLWNQGEMTAAEKAVGMTCEPYGGEKLDFNRILFLPQKCQYTNCERVWQLAARWSLDPMAIDWQNQPSSYGISGEISQARPG